MNRIVEKVNFPIPKQPKAKRVAAYARVSSGKDEMLHSLSAQISYYSELIQSHRVGCTAEYFPMKHIPEQRIIALAFKA